MKSFNLPTIIFLLLAVFSSGFAQNKDAEYAFQRKVFEQGLKFNDLEVAKGALYEMMVLHPDETNLLDSLAILYYQSNLPVNCLLVCEEIMTNNPQNKAILEIKAVTEQQLRMVKESLQDYEKLAAMTSDPYHYYQIATLQYGLKRYGECEMTINSLLENAQIDQEQVTISAGKQQQKVPLRAALVNMKGVLRVDLGKEDEAKGLFNEALAIKPDFQLALANLSAIEQTATPQETEEDIVPADSDAQEDKKKKKR